MAAKPFDTIAEINCRNSFILNWKNDKFYKAVCGITERKEYMISLILLKKCWHDTIETDDLNRIWRAVGKVLYAFNITDEVYVSSTFEEKYSFS